MDTITTQNRAWGFFGTLELSGAPDVPHLFDAAARALMTQLELTAEEARLVLDSKTGRHVADQYESGESAANLVARLIGRGWKTDLLRAAGRPSKATKKIVLPVESDEVPMLRCALEMALHAISEAHPKDRAQLNALLARLDAAESGT